jgi:hypothetical protein
MVGTLNAAARLDVAEWKFDPTFSADMYAGEREFKFSLCLAIGRIVLVMLTADGSPFSPTRDLNTRITDHLVH